jgi:hypothetical protein
VHLSAGENLPLGIPPDQLNGKWTSEEKRDVQIPTSLAPGDCIRHKNVRIQPKIAGSGTLTPGGLSSLGRVGSRLVAIVSDD